MRRSCTTLAVITAKGRKVVTAAIEDLNESVYQQIGLSEPKRGQLTELLAELRVGGNEFDVVRSAEVIEELGTRH